MTTIMEQSRSNAHLDQVFGQMVNEAAEGRPAEAPQLAEVPAKAANRGDGRSPVTSGSIVSRSRRSSRSEPPRPFWLTTPCPPWCTSDHSCEGCVADRVHFGNWYADVPLTLIDVPFEEQKGDAYGQHPQVARVHVEQHVREVEPHLWMGRGGSREGVHLTLAEARELAGDLVQAADLAEGHWSDDPDRPATDESERPFWQTEPCPAWCTWTHADSDEPDDRMHHSDWEAEVLLSLVSWFDLLPEHRISSRDEDFEPPSLLVYPEQRWREAEPHVYLGPEGGAPRWNLTLGETRQLADALIKAVDLAGGRRDDGSGE